MDRGDLTKLAARDRLAVVGVAKNCGKTTTLNALLRCRRRLGIAPPGLLSIGVDGEDEDALLGTDKPSVFVEEDQWIVTAEQAVERSTARFEYARTLGMSTPLGEVFVCRTIDEGTAMLAGLRHRREVICAVDALRSVGPGPVWVDGAYGRVAGAHRSVADEVVVATGAVCGADPQRIAKITEDLVTRLALPGADDEVGRRAIEGATKERRVVLIDEDRGVVPLSVESAVTGMEVVSKKWTSTVVGIAIAGLVSDRVVEELLALGDGYCLYVSDGTAIHADEALWSRLRSRWDVRALYPIEVAGISYNPTSLAGPRVDAARLEERLRRIDGKAVVFNPLG